MISADEFRNNVEAQLHYAAGLSQEEASAILESRLNDTWWEVAPSLWIEVASAVDKRTGRQGTDEALVSRLAQRLVGARLSPALHDVLPRVVTELIAAPATAASIGPVLDPLLKWVVQSARAGDAGLVANVMGALTSQSPLSSLSQAAQREYARLLFGRSPNAASTQGSLADPQGEEAQVRLEFRRRTEFLRSFVPLAQWMIEKGSAELRQPERMPLIAMLLECLAEGTPAELQLILRYVSLHSQSAEGFWPYHRDLFWMAAERVLAEGAPGTLIRELVARMYRGHWWAETCAHPLEVPEKLPLACQALLQGLVDGSFEVIASAGMQRFHPVAWGLAFQRAPPQAKPLRFMEVAPLALALEMLCANASASPAPLALVDWTHFLVKEWIRLHGLDAKELEALLKLTAFPILGPPVASGLKEALLAAPPTQDTPLALRILDECGGTPNALRAVLALELEWLKFAHRSPSRLEWLQDEFRRVLHLPWAEPVAGIDLARMFEGARDVRFTRLVEDDQVEIRGDCIYLHEPSYQQLDDSIANQEEFLATSMLFFLHEWVHVRQGIGKKSMVDLLRETGGESTLMHLDLSADHAAAKLAHQAEPRWTLAWLKELQSRSLFSYPAGRGHTSASRGRKTTRLVSLRLDYLVRAASQPPYWSSKLGAGYVFADLSPGGGAMLLLVSGPPVSVVANCRLSSEQTTFLTTIMDEREEVGDRLADLDELLRGRFHLR
ncbi:hypothetical protein JYK02_27235 [Corallococcus macrosporus]|uniref:DUF4132 domain-containing protein n=1 Tax=Corallococcus macrosporus TaxID=35 RepID=A0ABS3DIV0_9BACT|nr:hypothetical protein [Corallococcus macrosporus]MBN8231218.1 hypothetical protein [Corallococcus macrosporus]